MASYNPGNFGNSRTARPPGAYVLADPFASVPRHAHQPPVSPYSALSTALGASNHNLAPPLPIHGASSYSPSALAHGQLAPASPPLPAGRRRSSVSDPPHKRRSDAAASAAPRRSSKGQVHSGHAHSGGSDNWSRVHGEPGVAGARVPQPRLPARASGGALYPPLYIHRPSLSDPRGMRPGVRLPAGAAVRGDAPFFTNIPDRVVTLVFHWPGYPRPFHAKIPRAGTITTAEVLLRIADAFMDFVAEVQAQKIEVVPERQRWSITQHRDGSKGIQVTELVVVGLIHLWGSDWQPILEVV